MARAGAGKAAVKIPRLRERERADRSLRLWWEPEAAVRALGFQTVELDARNLPAARAEARRLNAAVDAARAGKAVAPSRKGLITVEEAVDDYLRSLWFSRLAAKTQKDYRAKARALVAKWGLDPVLSIDKPVMSTWYEALVREAGAHQALALVRFASIVFAHCERRGWLAAGANPCQRLGVQVPAGRARVAEWAEVDALIAAADRCGLPSVGHAVALSFYAGQRETDVLGARRGDVARHRVALVPGGPAADVWVWHLTRSKTGAAGDLLLHEELVARLAPLLARPMAADAPLIVEDRLGRAYDVDLFQKRWGEVRRAAVAGDAAAGVAGCPSVASLQFRDLRRSFSTHARRNGASRDDAGAALGNSAAVNARLAQTYMPPEFWTAARAVQALRRPDADQAPAPARDAAG